jgi:hypothetical protein
VSEEDIGLPTSLTDIGQMSGSFSDAMCSGVTGLKTDILFSPSGGFSMSGNHYLKNNNKKEKYNDPNPTNPYISRGLQISRPLPKRPHKTHSSGLPKGTDSRIPKGIKTPISQ